MKPRKPLKRSSKPISRSPLKRSSRPPRARKADKSKRRFADKRDMAYQGWIRTLPCVARNDGILKQHCGDGPSECAHVKARSTGGADRGNCVPLCARHHAQQHSWGIRSFQQFFGIDLLAIALDLAARYTKENE